MDYYSGGDRPYLVSGADDRLVKIWDYQVGVSMFMLDWRKWFGLGRVLDNEMAKVIIFRGRERCWTNNCLSLTLGRVSL